MENTKDFQIIFTTTDNFEFSKLLAKEIIEKKLAACVNILPNITSVYNWENKVETTEEYLLLIKTNNININQLEEFLIQKHNYDTPELISFQMESANNKYINWMTKNLA